MDPEDFHNFIYNLFLEVGDSDDFYEQVMDFMQVAFWMHGTIRLFQYAVERRYDSFNTFTTEPSTSGTSSATTSTAPTRPREAGQGDYSWLCLCGDEMDIEINRLERVIIDMQGRPDLSSGDIRTVRTQLDQFTAKLRAAERALVELRLVPDMSVFRPRAQSSPTAPQDPTQETKDSSKKGMKFKKGAKTQPPKKEPKQEELRKDEPIKNEPQKVESSIETILQPPQSASTTEQNIPSKSDSDLQLELKKRFFAKLAVTRQKLSEQESDDDDSNKSSSSNDESFKKPVFVIQNMPKDVTGKGLKFKKGLKLETKTNGPEDNIDVKPAYKTTDSQQTLGDDVITEETASQKKDSSQPSDENRDEIPEAEENTNTPAENIENETAKAKENSDSTTTAPMDEIEQKNVEQSQSAEQKESTITLDDNVYQKECSLAVDDLSTGLNKLQLIPLCPVPMLDLGQLSNDDDEDGFEHMHTAKTGSTLSLPLANYSDNSSEGENMPKGAKRLLDFSDEDEETFWFGSRPSDDNSDTAQIVIYFDEEVPEKETTWFEPRHSTYLPQGEFAKAIMECSEEEESACTESQLKHDKNATEGKPADSEVTKAWIGPVPRSSYLPRAPFDLPIVEYSDDDEENLFDKPLENDSKEVVASDRRKANFSDEDGENISCYGLLPIAPCKTSGSFSQAVVEYSDEEDGAWGGPRTDNPPRRAKCDDTLSDEEEEFTSYGPRQGPSYNARRIMDVIPTFGDYKASLANFDERSDYVDPMDGSSKLCVTSLAGDSDSTRDLLADFEDLESSAGYDASLDGSMVVSIVDSEASNSPMLYATETDLEMEEALYNIKVERMRPTGAIPKRPKKNTKQ